MEHFAVQFRTEEANPLKTSFLSAGADPALTFVNLGRG